MSEHGTETGEAFDSHGRRVGIGRDRSGALYLDFGLHLYLFEDGERDKLREGIDRSAMPGPAAPEADARVTIDGDGKVKPVSEFTAKEKWWCDGEDCDGGPLGPSLPVPHVHPYGGPALAVDLLTGRGVTRTT